MKWYSEPVRCASRSFCCFSRLSFAAWRRWFSADGFSVSILIKTKVTVWIKLKKRSSVFTVLDHHRLTFLPFHRRDHLYGAPPRVTRPHYDLRYLHLKIKHYFIFVNHIFLPKFDSRTMLSGGDASSSFRFPSRGGSAVDVLFVLGSLLKLAMVWLRIWNVLSTNGNSKWWKKYNIMCIVKIHDTKRAINAFLLKYIFKISYKI